MDILSGAHESGFSVQARSDINFCFDEVWEDKAAAKRKNRQADIIYCHGINDYGGKFADHAPYFLEAGYRIGTYVQLLFQAVHQALMQCGQCALIYRRTEGPRACIPMSPV